MQCQKISKRQVSTGQRSLDTHWQTFLGEIRAIPLYFRYSTKGPLHFQIEGSVRKNRLFILEKDCDIIYLIPLFLINLITGSAKASWIAHKLEVNQYFHLLLFPTTSAKK